MATAKGKFPLLAAAMRTKETAAGVKSRGPDEVGWEPGVGCCGLGRQLPLVLFLFFLVFLLLTPYTKLPKDPNTKVKGYNLHYHLALLPLEKNKF